MTKNSQIASKVCLLALCLWCVLMINACSVVLAVSGNKNPDMSLVKVGADKQIIEGQLGEPQESEPLEGAPGLLNIYGFKVGANPSMGRAFVHGVLDLVTFCLWEYIGFPYEISQSGDYQRLKVIYNAKNQAKKIEDITPRSTVVKGKSE